MNRGGIIRLTIFSFFLILILFFYYNIGFLTFSNANIDEELPTPVKDEKISIPQNIGSIDNATELTLGFEIVGMRGNNPDSTIIILDKDQYRLIEQGSNVTQQITFSHTDGSRAYFFDGNNYTFLDIIGSEKSFDQNRIDLIKE
ncbi:MAG: hypothetical protein CMQ75_01400 [Gammaproteobacteria bacterium]|nr:hypothetical protein [Gammaproteobacteria bacterium]|tara:strand:- start:12864 stop:13295 length:432 start_codon:yes stop_codon:yes gene_type:complete